MPELISTHVDMLPFCTQSLRNLKGQQANYVVNDRVEDCLHVAPANYDELDGEAIYDGLVRRLTVIK